MMKVQHCWLLLISLAIFVFSRCACPAPYIPVYFEDSHAGSFYWIVKNIDPSQKYQLILFDKHSDASEAFDSDEIRAEIHTNRANETIDQLIGDWRNRGLIQCFNWIEPLMPKPIEKVQWVAGKSLTETQIKEKSLEVQKEINSHEAAIKRDCGDLSSRFTVTDFTRIKNNKKEALPVIVSIDLDYFVDLNDAELEYHMQEVMDYILSLRNLQAVTVAISRPYLQSKEQADLLLYHSMSTFLHVANMQVIYEPFQETGPDRSNLAKEYYKKNLTVPQYHIAEASDTLKSLLLQFFEKIDVTYQTDRWVQLRSEWQKSLKYKPEIDIFINRRKTPVHQFNYVSVNDDLLLRVRSLHANEPVRIRWKVLSPIDKSINITKRNYGYADDTRKVIWHEEKTVLDTNSTELKGDTVNKIFDPQTGLGTARVFAEISDGQSIYKSDIVCISRYKDQSYLGKLTEIFNLPYVLGSSLIKDGSNAGADAKYGADCSSFIVYGQRRLGKIIPYLNPEQLRGYLIELDEVYRFVDGIAYGRKGTVFLSDKLIRNGLLLHFGGHIVAVYQDNDPKNVLDDNDFIVHQLEGYPEIIPLKNLRQINEPFQVMKFID